VKLIQTGLAVVLALSAGCSAASRPTATAPRPAASTPSGTGLGRPQPDSFPGCDPDAIAISYQYADAGTMHSYGTIRVTNRGRTICRLSRNLTVRTLGAGSRPRLTSVLDETSHSSAAIKPGASDWSETSTVADNLEHQRWCPAASEIVVNIGRMRTSFEIPPSSLHGKSRLILHFCHVQLTVEPLRHYRRWSRSRPGVAIAPAVTYERRARNSRWLWVADDAASTARDRGVGATACPYAAVMSPWIAVVDVTGAESPA
jgi:hypothetical protein